MNLHRNARLTPRGRRLLVERVCQARIALSVAAEAAGVSTRTASNGSGGIAEKAWRGWRIALRRRIGYPALRPRIASWQSLRCGACG